MATGTNNPSDQIPQSEKIYLVDKVINDLRYPRPPRPLTKEEKLELFEKLVEVGAIAYTSHGAHQQKALPEQGGRTLQESAKLGWQLHETLPVKIVQRDLGIGYVTQSSNNLPVKGNKEPPKNSVIIGHDVDTGEPVFLGDIERRSALYILGKSGMGKTELMINLMLQDIKHGHGVFFLDSHGAAVEKVIRRMPPERIHDVILLDPTDKTHAFGINLLSCKDVSDREKRNGVYDRARGVFERLERIWSDEFGLWLQLILAHTLWVFIENQGYTHL